MKSKYSTDLKALDDYLTAFEALSFEHFSNEAYSVPASPDQR
ncbi:hypothetical protein [Mesorhizobium waimense]|nr:hypothetical protein [Mesorhizobium waimense]